ncbi:hypothetical protein MTO96_012711 [Rhipicephalus appendiculatus]
MRELCDEWHIDQAKVRAIVTDGGQNIKAAVRDEFGADKHVSCVVHLLNQVGQAAIGLEVNKVPSEMEAHEIVIVPENEQEAEVLLDDVTDADHASYECTSLIALRPLLMTVKKIVRFFRTSDVASRLLVEMQMQDGPDGILLITCWSAF